MPVSLSDVLDNSVFLRAKPRMISGDADGLRRNVTWVHSSDIYEIAPLLNGGELLLTTGLGLASVDAGAKRHWVRELDERGLAGVAIEIGRSLHELPYEVLDEARKRDFPFMVLDEVFPFALICKEINSLILDRDSQPLRMADQITEATHQALMAQSGLAGVVEVASAVAGVPMVVSTVAGRMVAATTNRSSGLAPVQVDRDSTLTQAPILAGGSLWGTLILEPGAPHSPDVLEVIATRTAGAVAIAVMHAGGALSDEDSLSVALLGELADGTLVREQELLVRGGLVGFFPMPGQFVLGLCLDATDVVAASVIETAVRSYGGEAVIGRVRGVMVALVTSPRESTDQVGTVVEALENAARGVGLSGVAGVVGPAVPLARAARSIQQSLARLVLARPRNDIVASRQLTLDAMLDRFTEVELADLVSDLLGPLLDWDERHATELVHTLHIYLRSGQSPTRTARQLHLRRQSVHQRLARIDALMSRSLFDANTVEVLIIATGAAMHLSSHRR